MLLRTVRIRRARRKPLRVLSLGYFSLARPRARALFLDAGTGSLARTENTERTLVLEVWWARACRGR